MNPTIPLSSSPRAPSGDRAQLWMQLGLLVATVLPILPALDAEGFLALNVRVEALLLWVACLAPGWAYALAPPERRAPIPFLALFGVVYGAYFALPIATASNLQVYSTALGPEAYAAAADAAALGWAGVMVGVGAFRLGARAGRPARPAPLDGAVLLRWAVVIAGSGALLDMLVVTVTLPVIIQSTVAFGQALGRFGLVLGIILVARGHGRRADIVVLAACAAAITMALLGSGSLAGLLFFGVTLTFSAWVGRGFLRFREVAAGVALVLAVVAFKAVLPDFRDVAWYGSERLTRIERMALMASLTQERIEEGGEAALLEEGTTALSERAATADLLADVIQRTPSQVDYWNGETYLSLVGAFVPRLLWPDKPSKNLGQRFGHRYSYISPNDTWTSINMPWLVEFYANFGMRFVPVGGALVGLILGLLGWAMNRPGQSVLMTAMGITLLVPLYGLESDFSLNFGGLVLSGVALAVVVRWLRGMAAPPLQPQGR